MSNAPEVQILPFAPDDANFIYEQVVALDGLTLDPNVIKTTPEDFRSWLQLPTTSRPFDGRKAVAQNGESIGFVIFGDKGFSTWRGAINATTERSVLVDDMRVVPSFRSRGIGTRLIAEAAELALLEAIPMTLVVHNKNVGAQTLYKKLGGIVTGEDTSRQSPDLTMRFDKSALMNLVERENA